MPSLVTGNRLADGRQVLGPSLGSNTGGLFAWRKNSGKGELIATLPLAKGVGVCRTSFPHFNGMLCAASALVHWRPLALALEIYKSLLPP